MTAELGAELHDAAVELTRSELPSLAAAVSTAGEVVKASAALLDELHTLMARGQTPVPSLGAVERLSKALAGEPS